jgi:hypothetical protein
MVRQRPLRCISLAALALVLAVFVACSSDGNPGSGSAEGSSGSGGRSGGSAGKAGKDAGADGGASTASEAGASEAGSAGAAASAMPSAAFPSELEADVGCNGVTPDAALLIRNTGDELLMISSATADSGYIVKTALPLEIAPGSGANLLITPPAPSANADAGAVSTGELSFTTNEPGLPTHVVTLTTTVFDGRVEFTDGNGTAIDTLKLSYDSAGDCPSLTKYRLKNTGNATLTLTGPTFSAHFGGADLGDGGQAIPPGGYAELVVAADSSPGVVCSATGVLSFAVMGAFCGSAPQLNVEWPKSADPNAGSSCACMLPTL